MTQVQKKRKPAWTDRILWVSAGRAPPYRPITLHYSSHMGFTLSDHKPVSALFCLHFPFKVNVPLVTLEVEKEWTKFSDAIKLTVAHGFQRSSWDWVGLYKVGFKHQKDYVAYVWAKSEHSTQVQLPMSTPPAPACRSHSDSSDVSFEDDSTLVLLAPISRRTSPGNHSSKQHHQKRQRSRSPAVPALSGMPLLSLQSLSLCPRPHDDHPHSSSPHPSANSKKEHLVSPDTLTSPSLSPLSPWSPVSPVSAPEALIAALLGEPRPPQIGKAGDVIL